MKLHTKISRGLGILVSENRIFKVFPYTSLCKTSDHRAIVCIILVEVHRIKLHFKCRRPRHTSFRQDDFKSFAYKSLCKKIDLPIKKVKVNQRLSFFQPLLGPCPQCCIPSPIGPLVPEKKIFEGFLPYMSMVAIGHGGHWSSDPDAANKLLFPLSSEDPYEIWL